MLALVTVLLFSGPDSPTLHIPAEVVSTSGLTVSVDPEPAEDPLITGAVLFFDPGNCSWKIKSVIQGSPAERAGLAAGDAVLRFDDLTLSHRRVFDHCTGSDPVDESSQIGNVLRRHRDGDVIVIRVSSGKSAAVDREVALERLSVTFGRAGFPVPGPVPK